MKKNGQSKTSKYNYKSDTPQEIQFKDLLLTWKDQIEDKRRQWRLHRKLMAKSTPLEFCLRPHLALLIYTLALSLLVRGLSHLYGESAYWAFWWNENLATPIAWLWQGSWSKYSMSLEVEHTLITTEYTLMSFFIILGIICIYAPRRLSQSLRTHGQASSLDLRGAKITRKKAEMSADGQRLADPPRSTQWFARVFVFAALLQAFYVFCLWLSHEYRWASLAEHILQCLLPIACWMMLPFKPQSWEKPSELLLQASLALCFIGHGLYALDIAPLPADFVNMTMQITHLTEESSRYFLSFIGCLDLMAALIIYVPIHEFRRSALLYMMIWGSLTAFARPLGQPYVSFLDHLLQWGPECLWRLSHALIPLWLWRRRYTM